MVPAHPPFPTACSLLFQPEEGSQTSILMSESADGVSVALTRQKAGNCAKALDRMPPRLSGGANAPGLTLWTASIRPRSMESPRKSSHDAPAARTGADRTPHINAATAAEREVAA